MIEKFQALSEYVSIFFKKYFQSYKNLQKLFGIKMTKTSLCQSDDEGVFIVLYLIYFLVRK